MIHNHRYHLQEIIPQSELQAWRASLAKSRAANCPDEVSQFIDALAPKLPDFGRIGTYTTIMPGYDLLLSGIKEVNGEKVNVWGAYPIEVPRMVAQDHHTAMHRIFNRRGKQGLIDYCRARVKGTELERLLYILDVNVFHQERTAFKRTLEEINAAQKEESRIQP